MLFSKFQIEAELGVSEPRRPFIKPSSMAYRSFRDKERSHYSSLRVAEVVRRRRTSIPAEVRVLLTWQLLVVYECYQSVCVTVFRDIVARDYEIISCPWPTNS